MMSKLLEVITTEILALNCEYSPLAKTAGTDYHQNSPLSRLEVVNTVGQ
jgi:hypothetical protein